MRINLTLFIFIKIVKIIRKECWRLALFKISKGKSNNLPTNKVDGYCYVTTNDHKFYVDYTKEDGTLDRFALNAVYADTAGALTTSAGSST